MTNLRLYVAQFQGIEEPLYLVARNFDIALSDAHLFDKNNPVTTLIEVADKVHIDFRRENEAIELELHHD